MKTHTSTNTGTKIAAALITLAVAPHFKSLGKSLVAAAVLLSLPAACARAVKQEEKKHVRKARVMRHVRIALPTIGAAFLVITACTALVAPEHLRVVAFIGF